MANPVSLLRQDASLGKGEMSSLSQQWATGVSYSLNDIVWSGGYLIVCLSAHTSGTLATDVSAGRWQMAWPMKNYLFNGGLDIFQRGGTLPSANGFTADRWKFASGQGGFTGAATRSYATFGTTKSLYSLRMTQTSAAASNANNYFYQAQESAHTAPLIGKTITFSCMARSSVANQSVQFNAQYTNTLDDSSANLQNGTVISTTAVSMPLANTWYKCTGSLTLPSLNIQSITFAVVHAMNNFTQNGTFDFTDVMLNEGPAPASFQLQGMNVGNELQLCERFFEKQGCSSVNQYLMTTGIMGTSSATRLYGWLKMAKKRAIPTVSMRGTFGTDWGMTNIGTQAALTTAGVTMTLNTETRNTDYATWWWSWTGSPGVTNGAMYAITVVASPAVIPEFWIDAEI